MRKIIIFIAAVFIALPGIVQAQSERITLSTPEDIAIAFYRTANVTPNFRNWIWDRTPYKKTPAAHRDRVFDAEMSRIQTAWQGFNKRRDYLTVRFPVDIAVRDDSGAYHIGMTIKGLNQAHYLSYTFMKEQIAIFPFDMDVIMDSSIDEPLYLRLKAMNQRKERPFILAVLEAKQANATRPHEIDGVQQWVLKAKVQGLSLYSGDGGLVWQYLAPIKLSPNILREE